MTINFNAMHDIVVIKRDASSTVSAGGIDLVSIEPKSSLIGTVVAVGKGRHCEQTGVFVETTVKVGDRALFSSKAGYPIQLEDEDEDLIVMREIEIMGTV